MFSTLGISAEQIYGDVYAAWLRDTHEKNTSESKQLFQDVVRDGFLDRQIVLRRQRLGVNIMTSLATMLHRSVLNKIDLHGNALRDAGCDVLVHLMRDLPHLGYLDLGANDIGLTGIQSLSFAVAQHPKLSTLILGSPRDDPYANRVNAVGAMALLEGCLRSRTLRHLDLSGITLGIGELACAAASQSLHENGGYHSGSAGASEQGGRLVARRALLPSSSIAGTSGETQGNAGAGTTSVGSSIFGGGGAGARSPIELLQQLVQTSNTLSVLRLREVRISGEEALAFIDALQVNTVLSSLDLSQNDLPGTVAEALGRLLKDRVAVRNTVAIQTLLLSGNSFFGNGGIITGTRNRSRGSDPEKPNTMGEKPPLLSSRGAAGSGLQGGSTSAARKRLSPEQGAAGASPPQHMTSIASKGDLLFTSLSSDRSLTTLDLDACGVDDKAVDVLCHSLLSNDTLQSLSLQNNVVTARGAVSLGRALCGHPCLREVYVGGNAIEDEGVCALAYSLLENETLETLGLQRTWMGDRGLTAVGSALQRNPTLRRLHLSNNHFTHSGGEAFAALIERNETLLRCHLGATSFAYHTVLRIERRTELNRIKRQNARPDELKKEVVRLHFQKYKLEEAKGELEMLREKSADMKRAIENVSLQCKQDQSDHSKKVRELEEQIEAYTQQGERYNTQRGKLHEDLIMAEAQFADDVEVIQQRLEVESRVREQVEREAHALERELEDWKINAASREAAKRDHLAHVKQEMEQWGEQRKGYHEQLAALTSSVQELELQLRQCQALPTGKAVKKSSKKKRKA